MKAILAMSAYFILVAVCGFLLGAWSEHEYQKKQALEREQDKDLWDGKSGADDGL